jgi:tetratricopeptide (TPR) repeat protein
LDDKLGISWTTVTLGEVLNMQGDLATAKSMIEEGLALARAQDEKQAIGWGLSHLGYNALLRGDSEEAINNYLESAAVFELLGPHKAGLAWAYFGMGEAALARNDAPSAMKNLKMAVNYFNQYKNRLGIAWCIASLAGAMSELDLPEQAARLWGLAESLHDYKGVREAPVIKSLHEKLRETVRAHLGDGKFKAIMGEKQSTSLELAVSEAMAL